MYVYRYIYYKYSSDSQKGQRIPKSFNNKRFNKYSTINHKYYVSLSLQLIHVASSVL